ncbi:hypothetical protein COBT_001407 [Conglomerata obtusa]
MNRDGINLEELKLQESQKLNRHHVVSIEEIRQASASSQNNTDDESPSFNNNAAVSKNENNHPAGKSKSGITKAYQNDLSFFKRCRYAGIVTYVILLILTLALGI